MTASQTSADEALLRVVIKAAGEDALRLYKRVSCAARALGVKIEIEECKCNADPQVFVNGILLIEGLPRTEVIQQALAQRLPAREAEKSI